MHLLVWRQCIPNKKSRPCDLLTSLKAFAVRTPTSPRGTNVSPPDPA